jgi:hypothetical protein
MWIILPLRNFGVLLRSVVWLKYILVLLMFWIFQYIGRFAYAWITVFLPAVEKPPTILFRHQLGPIAQSNDGRLIVYPGTILHMECLWIRRFGTPKWVISHNYRWESVKMFVFVQCDILVFTFPTEVIWNVEHNSWLIKFLVFFYRLFIPYFLSTYMHDQYYV